MADLTDNPPRQLMGHPLLQLLTRHGPLMADHAQAYAELAAVEANQWASAGRRRALLWAVALCATGVAAVLASVSLMLWAVLPPTQILAPWALWLVPLLPLAVAGASLHAALDKPLTPAFAALRLQLQADLQLLREASP